MADRTEKVPGVNGDAHRSHPSGSAEGDRGDPPATSGLSACFAACERVASARRRADHFDELAALGPGPLEPERTVDAFNGLPLGKTPHYDREMIVAAWIAMAAIGGLLLIVGIWVGWWIATATR